MIRCTAPRSLTFLTAWLFIAASVVAADAPLPPKEAARQMTLPDGFQATLFAGEPDVVQPIAFTTDDRGRLWVVECTSYPDWKPDGRDRIVVFEDRDGDGSFDDRKVFYDKGANFSGLELGFGGVWVTATPNLLFIADQNGDDVPDAAPVVLLDGWDLKAKHNVFNGLNWGPDGWLYGCNGILSNSRVGKPGTADDKRVALNCGVWRYHPVRHAFEVVASGTTNPWGLDFDDFGQMFITNCVIKHLFHVIPGAHYQRMFGQDLTPNVYGLIESCADHIHWAGGPWQESRGNKPEHDRPGGGHAHAGAMVYLGDNWPDAYRNALLTCNVHGARINRDRLDPHGSGYVARHEKDFMMANDPWFRGLTVQYGPDGGVFVSDWTDTGECHDYDHVDRTNGRIFKITYGKAAPVNVNVARLSDAELVKLQLHKNDWFVRHARRVLHERAAAGKLAPTTHAGLRKLFEEQSDPTRRLRALWSLFVTGGLDESRIEAVLGDTNEYVRGWAVQLETDDGQVSPPMMSKLVKLATADSSPVARRYLASALQRLPLAEQLPLAAALIAHGEDAEDQNLPLLLWYGIEPLVAATDDGGLALLVKARVPLLREYIARRFASRAGDPAQASASLVPFVQLLGTSGDPGLQFDVLRGIHKAFEGRRKLPMPEGWQKTYAILEKSRNADVREQATLLALIFDDPVAFASLRRVMLDPAAPTAARQSALQALVQQNKPDLAPLLQGLLGDRAVRGAALRGLAAYADKATPGLILKQYATFNDADKYDAVNALASRPVYALALIEAMEQGQIARGDVPVVTVRQILALKDNPLSERLGKVWGTIRPTSKDKAALIAQYKALLTPDNLKQASLPHGRLVFSNTCAACHRLFDAGGTVGPELTGAQRTNLDYNLENLLDPSAVVGRDYQMTVIATDKGRVITGIVKQENDNAVTIQTSNESIVVPKNEIEERARSPLSMMPEGLLEKLSKDDVRDLIAYLASAGQVPLPEAKAH